MKRKKKYILLVLLFVVGIFLSFNGITLAKYVSSVIWDYYLKTKGFYFSSNYLGTSTVKNINNEWNGESVHFDLKNSLNQNVVTEYDIEYKVECTVLGDAATHVACQLNGTALNTVEGTITSSQLCVNNTGDEVDVSGYDKTSCETDGYTWIDEVVTNDLYFDLALTDINYKIVDIDVSIKVTSTAPYKKILNGEFTLHKSQRIENAISLDYKNYPNYDRLVISNPYLDAKCVKISWDAAKLLIDADPSEFDLYESDINGYINSVTFDIGGKKNLSYLFYKRNFAETYNVSEFTVEEVSGCQIN